MYEKMAQSLISTGKFSVNIIGFSSITHSDFPDIKFHPIFQFNRRGYRRLLSNLSFFIYLLKLKPKITIVSTTELSPALLLYYFLFPYTKIVYDIRENHHRNLVSNHLTHNGSRRWLAIMINWWEKLLVGYSHQIIVAEKGYLLEKSLLVNLNVKVIENKVISPVERLNRSAIKKPMQLLYTGTISTPYGIWDALRFAIQLHRVLKGKLIFTIIGHVTQAETYQQLTRLFQKNPWIKPTISDEPVSHHLLLEKMQMADFGIVSHQLLPSIWNCFPTRIWEYMAHQLPFFLQQHQPWVEYCQPHTCCVPVDFSLENWPMDDIISKLFNASFYKNGIPTDIYWEHEKFLSVILPLTKM